MEPGAARKETATASTRWVSWLAVAFWAAVAVWVAVWVIAPNCRWKVTLDLAAANRQAHVAGYCCTATFDRRLPRDAYVLEEVRELPLDTETGKATPQDIAALGKGLCQVDRAANVVYWSSSDGTDPLSNGRHYRLVGVRRWRPDLLTRIVAVLLPLALALVFTVWRRRGMADLAGWRHALVNGIDLLGTSPRWLRWALATVVLAGLLPVVTSNWNRYAIDTDTWDYCHGTFNRTPLTYYFLKMIDRRCDDPFPSTDPHVNWGVFHDGHSHYLAPVRAWKVLWLLAAAALVLVLARFVNVWLLAGTLCWLMATIPAGSSFDPTFWLDRILSEPLCYCVEILFLAAAGQYIRRRGWLCGILLGGLLAAAYLVRPSNLVFVAVLPVAWLAHWRPDGWRRATLRTAVLAVPLVLGTLAICEYNRREYGHFKTYAFKGFYLIAVAMQTATPDDIDAFTDPKMHEFMRLCLTDYAVHRQSEWSLRAADNNTFGMAVPSFCHVYIEPLPWDQRPDLQHYYQLADETFTAVARTLLLRHPAAYGKVVRTNLGVWWKQNPRTHAAALAALGLALLLYARTRRRTWLYLSFFTALPLLTTLPCLLTLYPLERYTAQLFFVEVAGLPLVVVSAVTHGFADLWRVKRDTPAASAVPPVRARAA